MGFFSFEQLSLLATFSPKQPLRNNPVPHLHKEGEYLIIEANNPKEILSGISPYLSFYTKIIFYISDITLLDEIDPKIVEEEKVVWFFPIEEKTIEEIAHALVEKIPIGVCLEIAYSSSWFASLKETIIRMRSSVEWDISERFYEDKIIENVVYNSRRIENEWDIQSCKGKGKGVPAIICGAGPSLPLLQEQVQKLQKKAIIFAGGTALSILESLEIKPDCVGAVDPNPREYQRFSHLAPIPYPLAYTTRLFKGVKSLFSSSKVCVSTICSIPFEQWLHNKVGAKEGPKLDRGEHSVTTMLLSLAMFMGCSPILLVGVDLAMAEDGIYPKEAGHLETADDKGAVVSAPGKNRTVQTRIGWINEMKTIDLMAKGYQNGSVIDCSPMGIQFETIPYQRLSQWIEILPELQLELSSFFTQRSSLDQVVMEKALHEMKESCYRAARLLDILLSPDSKKGEKIIAQYELYEEVAYAYCLRSVESISNKMHSNSSNLDVFNYEKMKELVLLICKLFEKEI